MFSLQPPRHIPTLPFLKVTILSTNIQRIMTKDCERVQRQSCHTYWLKTEDFWLAANGSERLRIDALAEGVGFEPTREREPPGGFQDRCLKPLGHPSDGRGLSREDTGPIVRSTVSSYTEIPQASLIRDRGVAAVTRALSDFVDPKIAGVVAGKRSRFDVCRISYRKTGVHFSGKCSNAHCL